MAETSASTRRRAPPIADGVRAVCQFRDGGVCRARTRRVGGDRRACPQTDRRDEGRPHPARGADRAPRRRGPLQCGDRRAALHQQAHRRVPPPQGLRQARHQRAHQTRTRPATRAELGAPPLARSARRLRGSGMRTRPGRGDHQPLEAERERGGGGGRDDQRTTETSLTQRAAESTDRTRWFALALIIAAQFMVVLDVAIVNVALPSIRTNLHFSQESLQWVITAYSILFGGVLLLGGRLADLLGRRRLFVVGLALFTVSSLLDGLAWSEGSLIAFRSLQGLGAALLSPAALSILTTTFTEGRERNLALGIWGAASGSGGAAGVLLGGALTSALSWSWIFFVNVPVGAVVLALTPWLLRESRAELDHRNFDAAGAASITGGLMLLVYAMTRATQHGWGTPETIVLLLGAVALVAVFVLIELRSKAPLLPLGIFRLRTLAGANASGLLLAGTLFSQFFLLTLYMQQVLHYSALKTGVAYDALTLTIIGF